ncbi:hypothetical protein Syun_017749 [Stephania yunnanensis]|uniref:RRM domain-containing protein n=1 Tax=Stephania yunnanensis TaxID=152371 RepID=A0AAP0J749_9MAGN
MEICTYEANLVELKEGIVGSREEYSVERLKKIFGAFGKVEDVVVQSKKKKKKRTINDLVFMASNDGTVSDTNLNFSTGSVCGDMSNPLIILSKKWCWQGW